MLYTSFLVLASVLYIANSQQGQNIYFAGGDNRQHTRFIPFQQNQFQAPQQSFLNYFPQTNGGPYSPFRSANFHAGDSNALSSSPKFQNQQQFSVPPFQLSSQSSDSSDPRFDSLISAPGVFTGGSNEDFGETGYVESAQDVPSQRFNSPDRQPNQFRSNQLTRYSPVAISEVTRTQDNPHSPNVLQTHSFNIHHTTRHPEELPLAQNNQWRSQTLSDNDNYNFRARNVPQQYFSSVRPAAVDTVTEDVFSKFNNNRFAPKEQSFLGDTQHPDVLESPETNSSEGDSSPTQYLSHDSYFSQTEKKKETTKPKSNNNVVRGKTNISIPPTTYSPSIFLEHRVRYTLSTTDSAGSEATVMTIRPPAGPRNSQGYRGRNRYTRPNTEVEKVTKNVKSKVDGAVNKVLSTTSSSSNVNFDVVTMSQDHLFVSEDNFKGFVDSASIDSTESLVTEDLKDALEEATEAAMPISHAPVKKKMLTAAGPKMEEERTGKKADEPTTERTRKISIARTTVFPSTSTEGYIIVASVQTSRSVSGARFIPSAAIKQEQHPLPLDTKSIKDIKSQINNRANDAVLSGSASSPKTTSPKSNATAKASSTLSTESIIDKLDQVQSDLSSGILNAFPPQEKQSVNVPSATSLTRSTEATSTLKSDDVAETSRRKFVPSKTTPKPKTDRNKSLFDSVQFDDLTDLLPPGFKVRTTFAPKNSHFTIKTTKGLDSSIVTTTTSTSSITNIIEKTNRKDKIKSNSLAGLKYKIKFDDVSAFLPPGYKPPPEELTSSEKMETATEKSSLTTVVKVPDILSKVKSVDLKNFLPPEYKLNTSADNSTKYPPILEKIKFKESHDLLPPDYTTELTKSSSIQEKSTTKTESGNGSKLVFPSRPGGGAKKPQTNTLKPGTSAKSSGLLPHQIPNIHKGWPIRATTEFTGWPTPSPNPISIEKILQTAKEALNRELSSEAEALTSTTITSPATTTTTRRTTTPGICSHDCDLFGSIKLVSGAKWVPELLDHNTKEYRLLANEVQHQLEMIFQSSEALSRWYKKITIDAFNPGSVIVDYFVEQSDLGRTVNTAEMKRFFHETLVQETVTSESFISTNNNDSRFLKLGKFVIDPLYTDFIVIQRSVMPAVHMAEDMWLPQWAIAVIVIGLASLLFVLIFGITVVISRHKNSKKHPTALTEEMLNELNKSHMGGFENYGAEDLYNMEDVWNEKPFKKRTSYYHDGSMPNIYDSWRSDWNGYYGNSYYNGSIRSGYSRRRSDYDTNF